MHRGQSRCLPEIYRKCWLPNKLQYVDLGYSLQVKVVPSLLAKCDKCDRSVTGPKSKP